MNDRLKFRYFNKFANKMVEPKNWQNVNGIYECLQQQVCFDENINPLPYDHIGNGLVFMQCTGIKDEKDKLIYESDIVKFKFDNDEIIGIITWSEDENVGWYIHTSNYYITVFDLMTDGEYEIIGNIYENKDLINNEELA